MNQQLKDKPVEIEKINWGASIGESIIGNLIRGTGGKFANKMEQAAVKDRLIRQAYLKVKASKAQAKLKNRYLSRLKKLTATKKATGKAKGKKKAKGGGGGGKGKPDPEARMKDVFKEMAKRGVDRGVLNDLAAFRAGGQLNDDQLNRLAQNGLVEFDLEGNARTTSRGAGLIRAARRGDVRASLDRLSKAKENVAKKKEKAEEKAEQIKELDEQIGQIDLDELELQIAEAQQLEDSGKVNQLRGRLNREQARIARLNERKQNLSTDVDEILTSLSKAETKNWAWAVLPPEIVQTVYQIQRQFDPSDLFTDARGGIENEPHITIAYGFDESITPDQALGIVQAQGLNGVDVTFEQIGIFENDNFDVVYVSVDSQDLNRLYLALRVLPGVAGNHPDYTPHMTLAYVKSGLGEKYLAMQNLLAGRRLTIQTIGYKQRDDKYFLPLSDLAIGKSQSDAPGYGLAKGSARHCENCLFAGGGQCDMFGHTLEKGYLCEAWDRGID